VLKTSFPTATFVIILLLAGCDQQSEITPDNSDTDVSFIFQSPTPNSTLRNVVACAKEQGTQGEGLNVKRVPKAPKIRIAAPTKIKKIATRDRSQLAEEMAAQSYGRFSNFAND